MTNIIHLLLPPGRHGQLYEKDSAHVVQRESLVEKKTTSVVLAAFNMLNLILNSHQKLDRQKLALIFGIHNFDATCFWRA